MATATEKKKRARSGPRRDGAIASAANGHGEVGALSTWIVLPHALDLKGVRTLKTELSSALDEGRPIIIDAGKVAKVSTASLQILAAFFAAAASAGICTSVVAATPPLRTAVQDLDLATLFPRSTFEASSCAS